MAISKFSRLIKDMAMILFFSAGIPAVIGFVLMYHQLNTVNDLQQVEFMRVQEQTENQVSVYLKNIQNNLESIAQTSELIDYILTPDELKVFSENRLVGRIKNFSGSLENNIYMVDQKGDIFFSYPDRTSVETLKNSDDVLLVEYPIQFDEQNLHNKNAAMRGNLVATVSKSELMDVFPQIKTISGRNLSDIKITTNQLKLIKTNSLFIYAISLILFMIISIFFGLRLAKIRVIDPIKSLAAEIFARTVNLNSAFQVGRIDSGNELKLLRDSFDIYITELSVAHDKQLEAEKAKAFAKLATQVAHDVRSPLSALNLVISSLKNVDEERRFILREATGRINDIANNLLSQYRHQVKKLSLELLPAVLDSIVSEKRFELRTKDAVKIELDLGASFDYFSEVDASQLKRIISNLINNSFEAIDRAGTIKLSIAPVNDFIVISIEDNGRGIPAEVLQKIQSSSISFGKAGSGSGLGLAHARETLAQWFGRLTLESQIGLGTTAKIYLKRKLAPTWFANSIAPVGRVIIVDDDQSIHEIWKHRLSNYTLVHMTSIQSFNEWKSCNVIKDSDLFLIDFEFLGHADSGMDLIRNHNLAKQSILVTSRYEENKVRESAKSLNVRILPKGLTPWVPIIKVPSEISVNF